MIAETVITTGGTVAALLVLIGSALGIIVKLMRTVPTYGELVDELNERVEQADQRTVLAEYDATVWRRRFARLHTHVLREGGSVPETIWSDEP